MLLVIDIGNTNTVVGVYKNSKQAHTNDLKGKTPKAIAVEGEAPAALPREGATRAPLIEHWRLETKKERTSDEYGILLKELFQFANLSFEDIDAVVVSSVVPPLDFAIDRMCQRYLKLTPLHINQTSKSLIKIKIDHPNELGADRIVNAVAGFKNYGGPLILVDFGTATTFDYINEKGEYRGGLITPGISISNEALFENASKLPHVEIKKPKRVIGRNTIESVQAGVYYGYVGLVDEIIRRMIKEIGGKKPKVIATGGFTSLIVPESKTIDKADAFLTLEGLKLLWEMNQNK